MNEADTCRFPTPDELRFRGFYLAYQQILQTPSAKLAEEASAEKAQTAPAQSAILQTTSEEFAIAIPDLARRFPLPPRWVG